MNTRLLRFAPQLSLMGAALLCALAILPAAAEESAMAGMEMMNPAAVKWGDAPPSLPKGAKLAVLYGDPGKEGPFVIRIKTPAGYKIPPHWHTQSEYLTVISGALYLGGGDKMDTSQAQALKAGGFHYLPAKAHHYAFSKAPTVIQVNGMGPLDINYLDPKDDPSGKQ
ncbi:cupin domain-containing protein [Cupriavidus sp. IDO]|uniref:cupin domain-containing protein n=1 Tax=Cupriavidus sp. IDO TaxID=1539142 RepID=UPI0005793440|nr:cupin domain-containing protein [Cupriavidus sp. IDO]KWR90129.1 hypothetical protein RM96_10555 [Cupriavidus sp. IDO]